MPEVNTTDSHGSHQITNLGYFCDPSWSAVDLRWSAAFWQTVFKLIVYHISYLQENYYLTSILVGSSQRGLLPHRSVEPYFTESGLLQHVNPTCMPPAYALTFFFYFYNMRSGWFHCSVHDRWKVTAIVSRNVGFLWSLECLGVWANAA